MLRVQNLCAGYGAGDVIHNVSFRAGERECLCLLGPNGCGKSTLLKAVARLIPSRGEMEIDGEPLDGMSRRELSLRVGLLTQAGGSYFAYTVYETVMLGRYPHLRRGPFAEPTAADRECVERCLRAVELGDVRDTDLSRLSGGQLQRVFLARAFAQEPQLILLDEPTNHLDFKYQLELVDYLRGWVREERRAVIGVLHDINLALRLADRLMLMRDGRIHARGSAEEVLNPSTLGEVYEVDVGAYMRESLGYWERFDANPE